MAEEGGDRLQPHAPVDGLGGQGVAQLVGVDADAAAAADAADDTADLVAVQGAAVVGGQAAAGADVGQVDGGPGGEQRDQLGVQGHVAVVAELAEGDAQPVGRSDEDDGVGLEIGEFAGPHAGAGEQFDDQAVAGVGAGPGGCHEPGRVAVVQESGERVGAGRDVAADDGVAGRCVGPVPLDDPLEEHAQHPQPLTESVSGQRAVGAVLLRQPHLEVLDVIAADPGG
jgi:hypothetical protein